MLSLFPYTKTSELKTTDNNKYLNRTTEHLSTFNPNQTKRLMLLSQSPSQSSQNIPKQQISKILNISEFRAVNKNPKQIRNSQTKRIILAKPKQV